MALVDSILHANAATWCAASAALILMTVYFRKAVVEIRIRRAGGARAPVIAGNIVTATRLYFGIAQSHFQNRFAENCTRILDTLPRQKNGSLQHFGEFSLTNKKRVLITRDPEQIKTVLATKFADFGHGAMWHRLWRPFLGDGIFATDGQQWHDSRAMIRPMFVKDRLRNLDIFDSCTSKLLSKLPASGVTVDVKDYFYRWTLDTTTDFLLGQNVNSLDVPDHEVAEAMSVAQRKQMLIFVLNPFAPLIPKEDYLLSIGKIEAFINPVIQRAIALQDQELEELSKSDHDFTFLHSIARYSKDPKVIRDQILSVLLAGRDTTAATMSWAIYEMSAYPQTWARLRNEVLDALGTNSRPTYEILKDMTYLKNVINETLRLHPAVPVNMREVLRDTTVPGNPGEPDIVLLKGDSVTIHTIGMHTRHDLYPPTSPKFLDPSLFSPERWEVWTPKPWTYTPFHGGPRICVGQNFALTEIAFCLVRFAQKFHRLEYRGDWVAQTLQADIIGTPGQGVPVAFFED